MAQQTITPKNREVAFLKSLLDQTLSFEATTTTGMMLRSLKSSLTLLYVELDKDPDAVGRLNEAFSRIKREW